MFTSSVWHLSLPPSPFPSIFSVDLGKWWNWSTKASLGQKSNNCQKNLIHASVHKHHSMRNTNYSTPLTKMAMEERWGKLCSCECMNVCECVYVCAHVCTWVCCVCVCVCVCVCACETCSFKLTFLIIHVLVSKTNVKQNSLTHSKRVYLSSTVI